ncbi:alpha-galactosidase [Arthrobacter sp. Hiyo4]|nr:alpha-galactosidase [Arthrobacter sp. Hiyo4]
MVLNTWEAVYFDHNLSTLIELADSAAELGVERFVLDDGWFRGRRDDHAGLGDWYVDESLWPDGLTPLIDAVTSRGMEFGLWVEPEMVNLDSDIVRAHPDWIVGPSARATRKAAACRWSGGTST